MHILSVLDGAALSLKNQVWKCSSIWSVPQGVCPALAVASSASFLELDQTLVVHALDISRLDYCNMRYMEMPLKCMQQLQAEQLNSCMSHATWQGCSTWPMKKYPWTCYVHDRGRTRRRLYPFTRRLQEAEKLPSWEPLPHYSMQWCWWSICCMLWGGASRDPVSQYNFFLTYPQVVHLVTNGSPQIYASYFSGIILSEGRRAGSSWKGGLGSSMYECHWDPPLRLSNQPPVQPNIYPDPPKLPRNCPLHHHVCTGGMPMKVAHNAVWQNYLWKQITRSAAESGS